jgi:hypothetical protein
MREYETSVLCLHRIGAQYPAIVAHDAVLIANPMLWQVPAVCKANNGPGP